MHRKLFNRNRILVSIFQALCFIH